jgi:hypothetical protein
LIFNATTIISSTIWHVHNGVINISNSHASFLTKKQVKELFVFCISLNYLLL